MISVLPRWPILASISVVTGWMIGLAGPWVLGASLARSQSLALFGLMFLGCAMLSLFLTLAVPEWMERRSIADLEAKIAVNNKQIEQLHSRVNTTEAQGNRRRFVVLQGGKK